MASVVFFESRIAAAPRNRDRWIFGLLMAAAVLTRVAGVFLLAAFAAHVATETVRRRRRPAAADLIPLVPAVGLTLAWWAVRPLAGGDIYGSIALARSTMPSSANSMSISAEAWVRASPRSRASGSQVT